MSVKEQLRVRENHENVLLVMKRLYLTCSLQTNHPWSLVSTGQEAPKASLEETSARSNPKCAFRELPRIQLPDDSTNVAKILAESMEMSLWNASLPLERMPDWFFSSS